MKKTIKHSLMLALPMLLVGMMFISLAHAASSVVDDPAGDSASPAPYMDVVHAKITQKGDGTLFFLMELAAAVPKAPSEGDLIWPFHINTDPTLFPGGPPENAYVDYVVRVRWSSVNNVCCSFVGQVINRTVFPTQITPVPFSVGGATVKVHVDPALLGNPSTFGWNASTRPGQNVPYVDFAPDGSNFGSGLATWTQ